MSMPNKRFSASKSWLWLIGGLIFFYYISPLVAETRQFSLSTAKGFPIKVLQDKEMPFVHAELLVFLDGSTQNYLSLLISQLTVTNMFAKELNSPSSSLLDSIFRLGNDYLVEQTPEYVKISLNFLPDRLASFTKVLREIFTYQSFHLDKFNQSKEKYWSFFAENRNRFFIGLPADHRELLFQPRFENSRIHQKHQSGAIAFLSPENFYSR
jgi:hypothetical protein